MELIKLSGNSYYIDGVNKVGVYLVGNDAYLIDSGNDKEAGKKILKLLNDQGFNLKVLINTHSNADHIGGNAYLSSNTDVLIYSSEIENAFIKFPILESSMLYGGNPFNELKNKFLMAKESNSIDISLLDSDLEVIDLPGHFLGMIGIKTKDNVFYLGDSLFGENIIDKYHIFYIYDVEEFLKTLDKLFLLKGTFVLSHASVTDNIRPLIMKNRDKILEIITVILDILSRPRTFEEILSIVFENYNLKMDANQFVLVGSTLKSYITYLINKGDIEYYFDKNKMYYIRK